MLWLITATFGASAPSETVSTRPATSGMCARSKYSGVVDWYIPRGNWSGSADKKLRTLRAGLCLQEAEGKQFLLYGYFSSATPSSMARVFQACGCRYAMLLDMNALEHTYMAVYHMQGSRLLTQHLIALALMTDENGALK